jgi:hypothetical protein
MSILYLFIFTNVAWGLDPKKVDQIESPDQFNQKIEAVKQKTLEIKKNGLPAGHNPRIKINWLKMAEEQEKKNKIKNSNAKKNEGIQTTQNLEANLNNNEPSMEELENGAVENVSTANKKSKKIKKKSTDENGVTRWRTVGPLDKKIRHEDTEETLEEESEEKKAQATTQPKLSPEEEKYQNEKEEFLKKFKK